MFEMDEQVQINCISNQFNLIFIILTYSLKIDYYVQEIGGHRSQWNSSQINNRHPWHLKKSKSWEPFWSYQLNSTANLANLAQL